MLFMLKKWSTTLEIKEFLAYVFSGYCENPFIAPFEALNPRSTHIFSTTSSLNLGPVAWEQISMELAWKCAEDQTAVSIKKDSRLNRRMGVPINLPEQKTRFSMFFYPAFIGTIRILEQL